MEKIKDAIKTLTKQVLKGSKKLYSISQPILYSKDEQYYIAVFAFPYTIRDIQKGEVERPSIWAIADIETGEMIEKYDCKEDKEFSEAKYEKKYSIKTEKLLDTSKEFYKDSYEMFDTIRERIIEDGELDEELYQTYLERVLSNVSEDLESFYTDLSI